MTNACRLLFLTPALCCCLAQGGEKPPPWLSLSAALPAATGTSALDQMLTFRVSRHLHRRYDPLAVHAGPSYLMALRASALPTFAQHRWLRFVELTAGYGARATSPGQRAPSWGEQKKQLYLGVSLDLSDWLRRRR